VAYAISGWRWRLRPLDKFVITVAGESGAGKSELASEIARLFTEEGFNTGVLQLDDYFVFPPKTNHEMRRRNLEQVGPYEVKLDFLNSNLRLIGLSFPPPNPTNSSISLADGYPAGSSEGRALAAQEPLRGATTDGEVTRPRSEMSHSPNLRIPRRALHVFLSI
jgi:Mrp family chromosome partitioning ATPase